MSKKKPSSGFLDLSVPSVKKYDVSKLENASPEPFENLQGTGQNPGQHVRGRPSYYEYDNLPSGEAKRDEHKISEYVQHDVSIDEAMDDELRWHPEGEIPDVPPPKMKRIFNSEIGIGGGPGTLGDTPRPWPQGEDSYRGDSYTFSTSRGKKKLATQEVYKEYRHSMHPEEIREYQSSPEDIDAARDAMVIQMLSESTTVCAVAVDLENDENNPPSLIRCYAGLPFGGYCHDVSRDGYLVHCNSFLHIGTLPFALSLTLPNMGGWRIKVPIPDRLVEKHLSPDQLGILDSFRKKFPSPRYAIHFFQMLGCQN